MPPSIRGADLFSLLGNPPDSTLPSGFREPEWSANLHIYISSHIGEATRLPPYISEHVRFGKPFFDVMYYKL
jgi:hypothetical protein